MKFSFLPRMIIFVLLFTSCQSSMKTIIHTSDAPAPIGPYSQAVLCGNTLYVSGNIAIVPSTGELNLSSIEEETKQVMKNIGAILRAAGMDYSNIVKSSIFLLDMNNFAKVNEVYATFFKSDFPARETVQVSRLPKDVNVEISVIAVK
jgi:2-iminobutanoate/2-iminopropanoate deaminase